MGAHALYHAAVFDWLLEKFPARGYHLGAHRLLDPATTGMLLGIRRSLIAETDATTIGQFVLIDMAVIAFANAMRLQSIFGNTALNS